MFDKKIAALQAWLLMATLNVKDGEYRRNAGFMAIVLTVIGIVVVSIILLIAPSLLGQVDKAAPTLTGLANTSYMSIKTGIFTSLNMTTLIPSVMVVGAVITILIGAFVVYQRTQ